MQRFQYDEVERLLAEYLGPVRVEPLPPRTGPDAVFRVEGTAFLLEYKGQGTPESVRVAVRQIQEYAADAGDVLPFVVVPFMGEAGKQICRAAGVSWMDLSGNARIVTPRIRVTVEGKPNRFVRRGRPRNAFAPKSSRVARALLLAPDRPRSQAELAEITRLDKGMVSKVVHRFEEMGLLGRTESNAVRPTDPDAMLDVWRASYDFAEHEVLRGGVAARSGTSLLERLSGDLGDAGLGHAATGLGAAWLHAPHASFRLVTLYVREHPSPQLLEAIGFRAEAAAANVWLTLPKDEGVFDGGTVRNGIPCVSALQTYLDLRSHPERAEEAAEELRRQKLTWRQDASQPGEGGGLHPGSPRPGDLHLSHGRVRSG